MLRARSVVLFSCFLSSVTAQISPGNVVVLRVGDGTAALTNAATAAFLDEYTPGGTYVQTVSLPTAQNGAHRPVTLSGTATSEGALTQTARAGHLLVAGYGIAPGGASVASSSSSSVNRVIARIGLDETIDSSTALADAYSGNNVRGAASYSGLEFWTAGTASAANNPSVRYVASLGATTSLQLDAAITNIRRVDVWNTEVYCVTASGSAFGVCQVGSGLPTNSPQTTTLLPGFPTATGPSPYDFFFANATTLYVADDRTTGLGGIQKWVQIAGVWTLQYTLAPASNVGCRGLSGIVAGGVTTLFATTTANTLVKVVDSGAAATALVLASAPTNTAYRGVRFVRTPASLQFIGQPCNTTAGPPYVGAAGEPVVGNAGFLLATDNTPPAALVLFAVMAGTVAPVGVPLPGAQPCVLVHVLPDVLVASVADAFGSAIYPLPIPNDGALGGVQLGLQSLVLDANLAAHPLPFGSSDAMQIVIGN
ncbi:MAG: hypothetical protein JNK15_23085 [Planctomycetes bacterium]|nr:hypothetical protein [Planctomycetota bacterium]